MDKELFYWKTRCEHAEEFIKLSPCDPDITTAQKEAYGKWKIYHDNESWGGFKHIKKEKKVG